MHRPSQRLFHTMSWNQLVTWDTLALVTECHTAPLLPDVGPGLVGACLVPRYCTGHRLLRGSSVQQGLLLLICGIL